MKKILSLICSVAIVLSLVIPAVKIEVSASEMDSWTLAGDAKIENGVLHLKSEKAEATIPSSLYGMRLLPEKYTVSYSMKVNSYSTSMGLQGGNGNNRAGFYIVKRQLRAMDTGDTVAVSDMESWHDYVIEVDHAAAVQKIYVDDVFVGQQTLGNASARNQFKFWCFGVGGDFEVSNFSMVSITQSAVSLAHSLSGLYIPRSLRPIRLR